MATAISGGWLGFVALVLHQRRLIALLRLERVRAISGSRLRTFSYSLFDCLEKPANNEIDLKIGLARGTFFVSCMHRSHILNIAQLAVYRKGLLYEYIVILILFVVSVFVETILGDLEGIVDVFIDSHA